MVLLTMFIMPFRIAFFFWALYKAFTFKSWFKKFNDKANSLSSLSTADKAMFVVNVVFYAPYILKFLDKFSPRYVRFWHGLTQCMLIRRDSLNVTGTEKEHGLAYYVVAAMACQLAGRVPFAIDSLNPLGVIGDNAVFDALVATAIVHLLSVKMLKSFFGAKGASTRKFLFMGWGMNKIRQLKRFAGALTPGAYDFTLIATPVNLLPWVFKVAFFSCVNIAGRTSRELTNEWLLRLETRRILAGAAAGERTAPTPSKAEKKAQKRAAKLAADRGKLASPHAATSLSLTLEAKRVARDVFLTFVKPWRKQYVWNVVLLVAVVVTQSDATLALLGPTLGPFAQTQTRMVIFTYVLYFYDSLGEPIAKFAMTDEDHVAFGSAAKAARKSEKAEWAADKIRRLKSFTPGKAKTA
jgi:hypothetical protein